MPVDPKRIWASGSQTPWFDRYMCAGKSTRCGPITEARAREAAHTTLITRGDDFGVSPGTNEALLDAVRVGSLRNISVMAPAPYLRHGLAELCSLHEEICIGLHATVTSEWEDARWGPVSEAAARCGLRQADGTFPRTIAESMKGADEDTIMEEIAAQLVLLRGVGLRPSYLDNHMCLHQHGTLASRMESFCRTEGLLFASQTCFRTVTINPDAPDEFLHSPQDVKRIPVAVFHPAYEDAVSRKFVKLTPNSSATLLRAKEAHFLTDINGFRRFASLARLLPVKYVDSSGFPEDRLARLDVGP